jgi:pyruvate-formate lyase-activating enzyme
MEMKKLLIVVALLFVAPMFAEDLDEYIRLLKTDLKAEAKDVIKKGMVTFTAEEAKRFWPIYEAYMAERGKFIESRVALIKSYADDYDKMTDAKAQDLLNRRFDQLRLRDQLDVKYRKQFATALSPRRLVRFYQIQHELEVMLEIIAVSQIPRMKWWQGE